MGNINDLLNSFKAATKGKLQTALGNNPSIYKEEIFAGLTDSEKKSMRTKIRKFIISVFESITSDKTTESTKKELVKEFVKFYKETYILNDFSVGSICSDNSKHQSLFEKGLTVVKKYNK